MDFSRFRAGILLRLVGLVATLAVLVWVMLNTSWYVTTMLLLAVVAGEVIALMHFATRSGREVARFLDAVAFDDSTHRLLRPVA